MSRFFSKSEYQKIMDFFGLGKIRTIEYFKQGLAAPKIHVKSTKGRYVIAKYKLGKGENFKNKPRTALRSEIDLLTSLENLPTPNYILNCKNDYILDYKGFAITVYKFLPGRAPKAMNEEKIFQLGKFLGNFHQQGAKFKNRFTARHIFYDFSNKKMKFMKKYAYNQKNKELKSVVAEVEREVIKNRPHYNFSQGPIHVDIKSDNELFQRDKLTGIIDFGNFYVGPYILDLGKTIIFNCVINNQINKKLKTQFLRGYESQRRLTKQEKKFLNRSILYAIYSHIWLDLYHVPLKLVPARHTLYFVKNFLPAARQLNKSL